MSSKVFDIGYEHLIACSSCLKRPATRLCDAPIGRVRTMGHPPKINHVFRVGRLEEPITCNRPICDQCAIRVTKVIYYCPACVERIKTVEKEMW